ncbi:hypothetical protein DFH09DRAFT_1082320 [Mycena vulgaris]|nr:hypothetical protein DFH09DRAFT_1082320 [Mycena vulgaris]
MNEIAARRQGQLEPPPNLTTAFVHIKVMRAGQYDPQIIARFKIVSDGLEEDATVHLTFDNPTIKMNFKSGILGATLSLLQKIPSNAPSLLCSTSDFLLKTLIKERLKSENNMLDPNFPLFKAVFAALNERVARTQFKQTMDTFPASLDLDTDLCPPLEVDTQLDLMFSCPGILISQGSQRIFTKIIKGSCPEPLRKATFINLDRIRCSVYEISDYTPTDEMIWNSIRSKTTPPRIILEVNSQHFQMFSVCQTCGVPENLEHIAMECDASGAKIIWGLTEKLWTMKYPKWPSLSWGLILGCNLVKFKHPNRKIIPAMGRLFAILNIRNDRVLKNPGRNITDTEIHNRWLKSINSALGRDRILTDKLKFGDLALNKDLVLRTWSGLLMNEDSLPDDWTYTVGVLKWDRITLRRLESHTMVLVRNGISSLDNFPSINWNFLVDPADEFWNASAD